MSVIRLFKSKTDIKLGYSPFSSTAILLFAQSNKAAATSKPIVFQKKKNDLLWQKMNERILIKIQKTETSVGNKSIIPRFEERKIDHFGFRADDQHCYFDKKSSIQYAIQEFSGGFLRF